MHGHGIATRVCSAWLGAQVRRSQLVLGLSHLVGIVGRVDQELLSAWEDGGIAHYQRAAQVWNAINSGK